MSSPSPPPASTAPAAPLEGALPSEFAVLEAWTQKWVCADTQARSEERQQSSFEELRAFYEAMLPHAKRALEHLAECSLGELAPPEARLLKLMLALAEVAPAVEWYGQSKVVDGLPAERFPAVAPIPDLARQRERRHP